MEPLSTVDTNGAGSSFVTYSNPAPITAGADAINGSLKQVQVTLTSAGTVYTVGLPATAKGFTLTPVTADVIFAMGEDPVALATKTGNTVSGDFGVGATAPVGVTTNRIMTRTVAQAGGDLRLRSATASCVVTVGIF